MPCEEDRMLKSRILFSALHAKHLVELLEFKAAKDKNMRVTSLPAPTAMPGISWSFSLSAFNLSL